MLKTLNPGDSKTAKNGCILCSLNCFQCIVNFKKTKLVEIHEKLFICFWLKKTHSKHWT